MEVSHQKDTMVADHFHLLEVVGCHFPIREVVQAVVLEVFRENPLLHRDRHGRSKGSTNPRYLVDSRAVHHPPPRSHLCLKDPVLHILAWAHQNDEHRKATMIAVPEDQFEICSQDGCP